MSECQHRLLHDLTIQRCPVHSAAHVDVWTWSVAAPAANRTCPCETADRYVVVSEEASAAWRQSADVLVVGPKPTLLAAVRVPRPASCALVVVPVPGWGTLLRTGTGRVKANPDECAVCAYPLRFAGRPDTVHARRA